MMAMPRYFKRTLFTSALVAVMVGSLGGIWAANRGTVVVFDANWCASCREIVPIAREVATQNGLGFVEIDIDAQNAPRQARNYGLNVPNDEPPQIFFVDKGHTSQLYSGRNYRYGNGQAARATMLQNLQKVLK